MSRTPSEHTEQVAVCRWLRLHRIPFFAVPNGGGRSKREGASLKAEGVVRGVADLIVMLPGGALCLEMKRRAGGRQSPAQRDWEQMVSEIPGWSYKLARGASEAIAILEETRCPRCGGTLPSLAHRLECK